MNPIAKRRTSLAVKYALMILYAVITIFPLYWTFVNSFRTNDQIFSKMVLWPENITYLENYKMIFEQNIPLAFKNSVVLTSISLVLLICCTLMAAYVLSAYRFKFAKVIYLLFAMGVVIPRLSILIATFRNFKSFGFLNQQYPIIFCYVTFELPLSIFLIVGFMQSLPSSVLESGIIDGCNSFRLLTQIVLPMSRNGLLTVIILSFVSIWNEYAYSLVLLSNRKFKTLTIALASSKTEFTIEYGMLSAGAVFAVVPIMLVYFFLQDKIISGMVVGAVKG
ncbi:Inner membrane ABC transporter permease protein ycjP [uncultured Ruminococcus sp.]|nr:Inner membrane ABC transporter permease protein ycjP [uncultured Ruminococcus sp.]SCH36634.1 Inner membrane ABC transporter permease protein ycjP [uncultured Clostridium sp.]